MPIDGLISLAVIAVGVIAAVAALRAVRAHRARGLEQHRAAIDHRKRAARALWAGATVLSVRTVTQLQDWSGKTVENVALPALRPGQRIPVKVDRSDPTVVYPNMSGAEYAITA